MRERTNVLIKEAPDMEAITEFMYPLPEPEDELPPEDEEDGGEG